MNFAAPSARRSPAAPSLRFRLPGFAFILATFAPSLMVAQTRPTPLPGDGGTVTPPIVIGPGGGGGGVVTPPIVIGPGGGGTVTQPTIIAPAGALAGTTVSASVVLGQSVTADAGTSGATYQWTITGGRFTSDSRNASISFVADTSGTVSLVANISAAGTSYAPTATVTIISAETAGNVTAAPSVAASATSVSASVPAAQNNDRTFRWNVSGGATITSGQNTNAITFRPGSPGLKQIVCNVTFRNIVTVPVRAYQVALGTGEPVSVTINAGSGGGTYPAGSVIEVLAHPPAPGKVFDQWVGDTALLGSGPLVPLLARGSLTVPAAAVTLTATYKDAPVWTPTTVANFNPQVQTGTAGTPTTVATTLHYHIPPEATGLVFLLHAAGSSASEWFERPNQLELARTLVAAGYGIAALHSINRTAGTWSAPSVLASNPDALNHSAALDRLVSTGALIANRPVFFLGNGAGANAAVRYADLLATGSPDRPIKGAVLYLSAGIDTLAVTSRVPQLFALAANDDTLGTTGLQDARTANQTLLGRGIATALFTNTLSSLPAARLRRLALTHATFTEEDAIAVWTALKTAGVIDANSYPRSVPTLAALTALLPAAYRDRADDVLAEIAIAAGEREIFTDSSARIVNFLNNRASDAPAPTPGRMVNLSTRGQVAFLGDSLNVGFTLSGTQRATVLIRAVGPTLSRYRVGDPLAAPRLEVLRGTALIAANEGWDSAGGAARTQLNNAAGAVGAFTLPNNSLDSALALQLDPGTYTATIRGIGGATGEVLAEIYDVSRNGTRLSNLSTLARVNREGDQVIPGLVVAGNNPRTLVVRAVSQGLTAFGYTSDLVLGDPRLTVYSGNQVVANNNNWAQAGSASLTAAFPAIGAFPLTNAADSAVLNVFDPGSYTVQAGATPITTQVPAGTVLPNSLGAVLVEIYEVP